MFPALNYFKSPFKPFYFARVAPILTLAIKYHYIIVVASYRPQFSPNVTFITQTAFKRVLNVTQM